MEDSRQIYEGACPKEVKGWNWGAFMFNILWGIGNKSYLPLLCLIPIFNIVWVFVCGIKGNEWAWKKGDYSSVDEFKKVQATWNRAGVVAFILSLVVVVLYLILGIGLFMSAVTYGQLQ